MAGQATINGLLSSNEHGNPLKTTSANSCTAQLGSRPQAKGHTYTTRATSATPASLMNPPCLAQRYGHNKSVLLSLARANVLVTAYGPLIGQYPVRNACDQSVTHTLRQYDSVKHVFYIALPDLPPGIPPLPSLATPRCARPSRDLCASCAAVRLGRSGRLAEGRRASAFARRRKRTCASRGGPRCFGTVTSRPRPSSLSVRRSLCKIGKARTQTSVARVMGGRRRKY